jgi:hypothetical protein
MTYNQLKAESVKYILYAFGKGENLDGAVSAIIQMTLLWRDEEDKKG